MRVLTLLGIRPDYVRACRLIPLLDKNLDSHILVHSGQHYQDNLFGSFLRELNIREPDFDMKIGESLSKSKNSYEYQIAKLFELFPQVIKKYQPDAVLTIGDTNTTLGSIIAARSDIPSVRIESGMRSFDSKTPEEINRKICDFISSYRYCYTQFNRDNLLAEGIPVNQCEVVGNIIVDAINSIKLPPPPAEKFNRIFCTVHRQENVSNYFRLENILSSLNHIGQESEVVLAMIPSAINAVKKHIGEDYKDKFPFVNFIEPVSFLDCLVYQRDSKVVVHDSGTLQEESFILGTPSLVLRRSTERAETIEGGGTILEGEPTEDSILNAYYYGVQNIIDKDDKWDTSIMGNGKTSERICSSLKRLFDSGYFEQLKQLPMANPRVARAAGLI